VLHPLGAAAAVREVDVKEYPFLAKTRNRLHRQLAIR
jgi:hypothetical protein